MLEMAIQKFLNNEIVIGMTMQQHRVQELCEKRIAKEAVVRYTGVLTYVR